MNNLNKTMLFGKIPDLPALKNFPTADPRNEATLLRAGQVPKGHKVVEPYLRITSLPNLRGSLVTPAWMVPKNDGGAFILNAPPHSTREILR